MYECSYFYKCNAVLLYSTVAYVLTDSVHFIYKCHFFFLVYKYPYLLAFTEDAVEIRTTSNGSLVKNIGAPNLHLISYKVNWKYCICDKIWETVLY